MLDAIRRMLGQAGSGSAARDSGTGAGSTAPGAGSTMGADPAAQRAAAPTGSRTAPPDDMDKCAGRSFVQLFDESSANYHV